jgi:hypothetical protein
MFLNIMKAAMVAILVAYGVIVVLVVYWLFKALGV